MRFIFLLLLSTAVTAQNINPDADQVFRPTEVATIRLTLAPEHKAFLLDPANAESEEYFPATFFMSNSQFDTTLVEQVGVRLRGNTSRYHNKKGFKIDFREFDGSKFYDYKKFNLKPDVNDPSLMREMLTLLYYREMNVPAARTHPVRFYMNDEYMGAYLNVEQVDDEFLNDRHGHEEGFLYKCSWGANLLDNGQVFNAAIFESEINEEDDTRAELDHFVEVLNTTPSSNFKIEIEKVFDVQTYLRQLAVEAMLGHWDGYSYNQNNYYLFYNGETGLVEFFPYDADNTWGIDWVDRDWATRPLLQWYAGGQSRPLTTRILAVPEYKEQYVTNLKTLARNFFNETYLQPLLDNYKTLLSPAIEADTYFDDAFGFTYADFLASFETGMDNHVEYGIKEYLQLRTSTALTEVLDLITTVEEGRDRTVGVYPNPSQEPRLVISGVDRSSYVQVFASTGAAAKVRVTPVNGDIHVELEKENDVGLYYVRIGSTTIKWLYRN